VNGVSVISALNGPSVVTAAVTVQIVATEPIAVSGLTAAIVVLAHAQARHQKNHVRHVTDRQ
jgi:hypothetical protein